MTRERPGTPCSAALADGMHVRVGFEDAVMLPGGRPARNNAELDEWADRATHEAGREVATAAQARTICGCDSRW